MAFHVLRILRLRGAHAPENYSSYHPLCDVVIGSPGLPQVMDHVIDEMRLDR